MKTRGASIAACLTIGTLLLAACGSGGDGDAGGDAGPITLKFQSLSDQPAAIAATERSSRTGTRPTRRPGRDRACGWDGIYDKLITQFNGGAAPDIIHYEAASIVPFAADGYLADLTEHMSDEFRSDVPEGILDAVTVDGKIIAYPTELQSYMVFANKTLLDAAGVDIPTGETMTWDEMRAIAQATTGRHVTAWAGGSSSPTAAFMALAPGFGGTFFEGSGSDATLTVGEGEMAVPELVDAMAYQDKSIARDAEPDGVRDARDLLRRSGRHDGPGFVPGREHRERRPRGLRLDRAPAARGLGGCRAGCQPADAVREHRLRARRRVGGVHRVLHADREPGRPQRGRRAHPRDDLGAGGPGEPSSAPRTAGT